jgi:hypothetical protein
VLVSAFFGKPTAPSLAIPGKPKLRGFAIACRSRRKPGGRGALTPLLNPAAWGHADYRRLRQAAARSDRSLEAASPDPAGGISLRRLRGLHAVFGDAGVPGHIPPPGDPAPRVHGVGRGCRRDAGHLAFSLGIFPPIPISKNGRASASNMARYHALMGIQALF